jgi:hypothetical protein
MDQLAGSRRDRILALDYGRPASPVDLDHYNALADVNEGRAKEAIARWVATGFTTAFINKTLAHQAMSRLFDEPNSIERGAIRVLTRDMSPDCVNTRALAGQLQSAVTPTLVAALHKVSKKYKMPPNQWDGLTRLGLLATCSELMRQWSTSNRDRKPGMALELLISTLAVVAGPRHAENLIAITWIDRHPRGCSDLAFALLLRVRVCGDDERAHRAMAPLVLAACWDEYEMLVRRRLPGQSVELRASPTPFGTPTEATGVPPWVGIRM